MTKSGGQPFHTLSRAAALLLSCLAACHESTPSGPLPQRAYVWQREWTPAVSAAVIQASPKLAGLVIFGADISWRDGKPKTLRCAIDWKTLRDLHKPVGIAMRIAPWRGPFDNELVTHEIVSQSLALLQRAKQEQVECNEFQIDFDCAQKKLDGYSLWLKALREAVKPTRFVITTLPAWLDEPAFSRMLAQVDGWVLQVHSAMPEKADARVSACDPERARKWVAKAEKLRKPFEVALSTYSAQAGYNEQGKLLGLALDGIQPAWPAGTRIMQFDSDADELAKLVGEWQAWHPTGMQGILWYRLPVTTDQRNWRWPTFAAVIEGRFPTHHLTVRTEGGNPVDLSVVNDGEADESLDHAEVISTWPGPAPEAAEALPGWTVSLDANQARFVHAKEQTRRLPPGARQNIGWLRFNHATAVRVEVRP